MTSHDSVKGTLGTSWLRMDTGTEEEHEVVRTKKEEAALALASLVWLEDATADELLRDKRKNAVTQ